MTNAIKFSVTEQHSRGGLCPMGGSLFQKLVLNLFPSKHITLPSSHCLYVVDELKNVPQAVQI